MNDKFVEQLKRHEGFLGYPYKCPAGATSIGYGRNLDSRPLTKAEAEILLVNDIVEHWAELRKAHRIVSGFDGVRQSAICNMAFNMGVPRLNGFRRMWAALQAHQWDKAADEALDSRWARQVGDRAVEIAGMIRTGEWRE